MVVGMGIFTDPLEVACDAAQAEIRKMYDASKQRITSWEIGWAPARASIRVQTSLAPVVHQRDHIDPLIRRIPRR